MPRGGVPGLRNGMTVLNVAEKNDAAKRLSQIMSAGNSQRVRKNFNNLMMNKTLKFYFKYILDEVQSGEKKKSCLKLENMNVI